ncbi:MAG: nuclear transport factor 2 family protein [Actinobacteria bacterium]|nr:nuclear transport factor 2 family protein [Actinomycetota bacterium]
MSRENVEVVRRAYEAFVRGDQAGLLAAWDPQIEWQTREDLPDTATHSGHDEVLRWIARWLESWEDFKLETEDFIDAGEYVVVSTRQSGTGSESGAYAEFQETHVCKLRNGRVIQVVEYRTKTEALEAVGLSE